MNVFGYRRLTNLCFFVAAVSLLLFDLVPASHGLAGVLLIASGIVAIGAHFYLQSHPTRANSGVIAAVCESNCRELPKKAPTAAVSSNFADLRWVNVRVDVTKSTLTTAKSYSVRPILRPDVVAQVCEKLAAGPVDFEVTLTPEGDLRIRPIRQMQSHTFENMKPRAKSDHTLISNLVH
jgi:hypothetical protein